MRFSYAGSGPKGAQTWRARATKRAAAATRTAADPGSLLQPRVGREWENAKQGREATRAQNACDLWPTCQL